MRRMRRPDVRLPTLQAVTDWRDCRDSKGKFQAKWNAPDVRGALLAMHGAVCSYCLGDLRRGDRGDVEHFRPKSRYPWLAYRFSNYFLSCIKCNQHLKRSEFPVSDESQRAESDEQLTGEPRLLIDPAEDAQLEDWLEYNLDHEHFALGPSVHAAKNRDRVEKTIEFFELNFEPDLVRTRADVIDELLPQLCLARRGLLQPDQRLKLRKLISRRTPLGAARRLVLRDLAANNQQIADLLPTDEEEMRWWVEELIAEIGWIDSLIGTANRPQTRRRLKVRGLEHRWALAATWQSPEPLSPEAVEH